MPAVSKTRVRAKLFSLPKPRTTLTFDLDSGILTVYGKLQFARVGYNPRKRGRRSYHPLLCFEAHLQEFWHGSLRPGDAGASTGVVPFLKLCLAKVPKQIARSRIRIRGDSGFFGKRTVEFLDFVGSGYAIVAREYHPIKSRARECRFRALGNGWEVGEFRYRPLKWKRPHRFVVVRRPIRTDFLGTHSTEVLATRDEITEMPGVKKILVTGGAGYIGSILTPALLAAGYEVTVLDNFMFRQTSLLECCWHERFSVIRGDCRDKDVLQRAMKDLRGWRMATWS